MKLFNRWFFALFFCALLVASTRAATAQRNRIRLNVWGLQSGKETKGLDAQVAEFEKRNPDIEVSLLSMGAGGMNPQKLMTAIVGGVAPDVIQQDRFTLGDWASRDAFRSLDEFLLREKGAKNALSARDFYPAAWNETLYKNHVYAIPTGIDDRLMYYNRKLFREAGLNPDKPPRTWEELKIAAKKLTKMRRDGTFERIGFIPNYGNSWLYLYSWQNGGEFMSADGRTCTRDNKDTVGALKYIVDFYDMLGGTDKINIFQSGFQGAEQDPFITGKIAMVITGSWVLPSVARYAPGLDFSVAPAPVPAERLASTRDPKSRFYGKPPFITWTGGFAFAMPRGSPHPEEAWKFIKWMTSEEATIIGARADKAFNRSKGRPYIYNLTSQPKLNATMQRLFPPTQQKFKHAQQQFIDMLTVARYRPVTFVGQTLWDQHVRAFDQAVAHVQTPQAALTEGRVLVQKELNKAFARETLPVFSFVWPAIIAGAAFLALCVFGFLRVRKMVGSSSAAKKEAIAGYLMISPWLIGFLLLTVGPILASIVFAFCDYDVLHAPRYVGLANFHGLLTDDRDLMFKSLYNAAYLAVIGIPLGMATGLAIAMLLNMSVKGMGWYRTAFYIPSIVPAVASAVLWGWILAGDPSKGLLNSLWQSTLTPLFGWTPPGWFGVAEWAKPGLIIQGLWGAGGGMILWLAGLQGVPAGLYEAARIDGARGWAQFRHVMALTLIQWQAQKRWVHYETEKN